jgi:DeoR/GlpR family transcriptional regulator of sugar metabolism
MSEEERPVFADERQQRIAEIVGVRGRARIGELAEILGVTEPTIRKDLTALQAQGAVKRTHGGAVAVRQVPERELSVREVTQRDAKLAIATTCLGLLQAGDSVFLDNGTTVGTVAEAIAANPSLAPRNLAVLTNAVPVAIALADAPGIEHVLLGGSLRRTTGSIVGALALNTLQRFAVSVAIISASGFSEAGISVASPAEAEVKAAVIDTAGRVIVAVDHTKVGNTDFARICELDAIDTLVTDRTTKELAQLCARHEITLVEATSP